MNLFNGITILLDLGSEQLYTELGLAILVAFEQERQPRPSLLFPPPGPSRVHCPITPMGTTAAAVLPPLSRCARLPDATHFKGMPQKILVFR